jgi:phosphatidate cytidylyltransferase
VADPARPTGDRGASPPSPLGPPVPMVPGRNMPAAVATSAVLLVAVGVCYVAGPTYFFWLAAAAVLAAQFELLDAVRRSGRSVVIGWGLALTLGLLAAAYFRPGRPEFLVLVAAVGVFGSFVLALRPARGSNPGSDVAWTVLALGWVGGAGAAAVSMLALPVGVNLLVAHVLVTAVDDVAAYFAGTAFGRHKLAPSISPAKSWEGAVGGFAAALAAGAVAGALIGRLGVAHGLAIGAINGLLAPAGDLAESMAKRELGIKDSGRLLPGHGGVLDRIDAIMFCAPATLLYLRLIVF